MSGNSTEHINESMNEQVTKKPATIASTDQTSQFLGLVSNVAYIEADAFNGNPYAILGSVIEVRKQNGVCPARLNATGVVPEFSASKIPGAKVDESSKLKEPIKRQSILIDRKLSGEVSFLNYLSTQFDGESSFSLLVFDQTAGLIDRDDSSWNEGLKTWKEENQDLIDDDEICYLFAVIGFTQKYVIRKTYKKFDVKAKGGAFGVNINGALYTSEEDYSLDIRYGLQPVTIKRPQTVAALGVAPTPLVSLPTAEEYKLFQSIYAIGTKQ